MLVNLKSPARPLLGKHFDTSEYERKFKSTSARRAPAKKGADDEERGFTIRQLLPVQFPETAEDKAEWAMFRACFYPDRSIAKSHKTHRTDYLNYAQYLANCSALINSAYYLFRYVIMNANWLSVSDDVEKEISERWDQQLLKIEGSLVDWTVNYLSTLSSGRAHVVQDSQRFKGGFDLVYCGLPGSQMCVNVDASNLLPVSKRSEQFRSLNAEGGNLSFELAQHALVACRILGESLCEKGANDLKRVSQRQMFTKDFAFNMVEAISKAFKEFQKRTGIRMPEVPAVKLPETLINGIGHYASLLVIREPTNEHLSFRVGNPDEPEENSPVSDSSLMAQPEIALSIRISIPDRVAHYIAQALPNETPSLVALNMWASVWSSGLLRPPRARGGISMNWIPRYVVPASKTADMIKRRKELGLYTEEGRSDDNNLYITPNGTLSHLPKSSELNVDNARNYEATLEKALKLAFEAGTPLNAVSEARPHLVYQLNNPDYAKNIEATRAQLQKYKGSVQSYSWDYNTILTTSVAEPDKVVARSLVGATKPDELFIADFMRQSYSGAMTQMFSGALTTDESGATIGSVLNVADAFAGATGGINKVSLFHYTFQLYAYLFRKKLLPNFQDLIREAASELGIKSLDDEAVAGYEKGLYREMITKNLTTTVEDPEQGIKTVFTEAFADAHGGDRSNLHAVVYKRNGENGTNDTIADDDHYFGQDAKFHEISNVFNYLGGRIFQVAAKHILKTDPKNYIVIDPNVNMQPVPYLVLSSEVIPFLTMIAKILPKKEELFAKADEIEEQIKREDSVDPSDIHLPGSQEGFQLFPHQVSSENSLMKHPRFAILDIAPGGGKTTIILVDVGQLVHENLIKRPVVLCPGRLAKNWIEDMQKFTGDKWNMVPITTNVYNKWGEEKLINLFNKAPRNTIFVIGTEFLSRVKAQQIVIGRHVERISPTLEFVKRFGFDYVAMDESHKAKNSQSNTHRMIKQLTTCSSVKYLRLATGTLISDVLKDIVGQTALYSGYVFRSAREFDDQNKEISVGLGGRKSEVYMAAAAQTARKRLARYATVITVKRREWAFMLPIPVEKFFFTSLIDEGVPNGDAHMLMYEALYNKTLDAIKNDKDVMDILSGREEDDEDEGDAPSEGEDDLAKTALDAALAGSGSAVESDQSDDIINELEAALQPYLQRLEMAIIDPLNDRDLEGNEFGSVFFKGINQSDFVSRPVRKVIERIKEHYKKIPWEKGRAYSQGEAADHMGSRYTLTGAKKGEKYVSVQSPDQDAKMWKKEAFGKVLVFCRYTRSVEAIYRALPPELKKIARRFHGEIDERWSNVEEFKSSPVASPYDIESARGVQILIANEMAIAEGHNMQMASRMIRVELPWAPGDLDQSSARLFRPDPSGKFARESIYLDWIIANGTIVVAKLGRLISKMLTKAQFDEADNEFKITRPDGSTFGYDDLNRANLPPIKMSLKNIANIRYKEDLVDKTEGRDIDYLDEYQNLVELQSTEFVEIRKTRPSKMIPIDPTPMPKDAAKMEFVPYIPDLTLPDPNNWGLHRLNLFLQNETDPKVKDVLDDKRKLIGKYVHTEFGNGVITKVHTTSVKKIGDEEDDPRRKLSTVTVQLAGTGELVSLDPDVVFLANNLDAKSVNLFAPKSRWMSAADKKRQDALDKKRLAAEEREAKRTEREAARERKDLQRMKLLAENSLTKDTTRTRKPRVVEPVEEELAFELYPAVYNGYLAIEAITDDEDAGSTLGSYGFKEVKHYAFAKITNYANFTALLDFLESRFSISRQTLERLDVLHEAFQSGRGRKFAVELAPVAEFKNFYRIAHRPAAAKGPNGKPELKLYPVIINQSLFLNIDMATNPAARRLIGKVIPGTNIKFSDDSMHIAFFSNKAAMKSKVLELKKDGLVPSNFEEFKEEFAALNTKAPKAEEPVAKPKPAAKKVAVKTPIRVKETTKAPAKKAVRTTKAAPAARTKVATKTRSPVKTKVASAKKVVAKPAAIPTRRAAPKAAPAKPKRR